MPVLGTHGPATVEHASADRVPAGHGQYCGDASALVAARDGLPGRSADLDWRLERRSHPPRHPPREPSRWRESFGQATSGDQPVKIVGQAFSAFRRQSFLHRARRQAISAVGLRGPLQEGAQHGGFFCTTDCLAHALQSCSQRTPCGPSGTNRPKLASSTISVASLSTSGPMRWGPRE